MLYRVLADLVLVAHALFVCFVAAGGLAVPWRRWVAWLHIPAALWGAFIMFSGRLCPLTPLENRLREMAGQAGYEGGFIEHYLLAAIYPQGMTREMQLMLGMLVVSGNLALYGWAWRRARRRQA